MFKKFFTGAIIVIAVVGLITFGTGQQQKAYASGYTLSNQAEKLVVSGVIKPIVGISEIPLSMIDGVAKRDGFGGKLWGMTFALPFNAAYGALKTGIGGLAGVGNVATSLFSPKHIEADLSDTPKSIL